MIVQEAGTLPNITVAENIFMGHEELYKKGFHVNWKKMMDVTHKLL